MRELIIRTIMWQMKIKINPKMLIYQTVKTMNTFRAIDVNFCNLLLFYKINYILQIVMCINYVHHYI